MFNLYATLHRMVWVSCSSSEKAFKQRHVKDIHCEYVLYPSVSDPLLLRW